MAKPRKLWSEYSDSYKKRLKAQGITSRNYRTKAAQAKRKSARGHATTPERPSQAERHPEKFGEYIQRRISLRDRVLARKRQLFQNYVNPTRVRRDRRKYLWTEKRAANFEENEDNEQAMKDFLAMSEDEARVWVATVGSWAAHRTNLDEVEIWQFMFYH